MRFDRKLRMLLDSRMLTPTDLGRAIGGVAKSTVHNWANDVSRPGLDDALRIARFFGVPLEFLADDAADEPPAPAVSPEESGLLDLIRELGVIEAKRRLILASPRLTTAAPPPIDADGSLIRDNRPLRASRKGRTG